MRPEIWGPHLWFMLHVISFEYPENPTEYDKRIYHDFYTSLKDVIPCEMCKKHYREHIHKYPLTPHLDTRDNLVKWVIQVHNFVNTSLGKPTLTVPEVMTIYSNLNPVSPFITINTQAIIDKHRKKDNARLYFLIIVMGIIIFIVRYYFNRYYFSIC
jgi:hypothetical protein